MIVSLDRVQSVVIADSWEGLRRERPSIMGTVGTHV